MRAMSRILTIVVGLAALPLASAALAQESVSALKGHDPDAPIDVAADRIEVQDRSDRAVFAGNVHVRDRVSTAGVFAHRWVTGWRVEIEPARPSPW